MEQLAEPMDQEEEQRIWSAFKLAAPSATTGTDEDALDKERALKFPRPEGKGGSG